MAHTQHQIDFSKRGQQLRILRRVSLPPADGPRLADGSPGSRVRPASLLATLQAIDDCIGSETEWNISIARLVQASGLSRRTVQRAIHGLLTLQVITVTDRYRNGRQCSSRFRIGWANLLDFVDDSHTPAGSLHSEQFAPRGATVAPPRATVAPPGVSPLRPRGRHHDAQPAQSPAHTSAPSPSPPPLADSCDGKGQISDETPAARPASGRGTVNLWDTLIRSPETLSRAVRYRRHDILQTLWQAAVDQHWQQDDRDIRRRFLAACWFVVNPPPGFPVDNAARLLRYKLQRADWKTGCMDGSDDDFARDMERRIEGTHSLPRSSRQDDYAATDQARNQARQQLAVAVTKKATAQ